MRYRDQRKVAEEWMDLQKMRRLFGHEARQVVDEFEGKRPEGDEEPVVGESSRVESCTLAVCRAHSRACPWRVRGVVADAD